IRLARPLGASPRNRTSRRLLGEIGRGFFQNVALHLQLRDFPAQALDLRLFRLHDALPWERKLWIRFVLPDPTTQEIRMNIQIPRRLSCCDPAIRDQLYRLDLKLPAECSPCHLPPPVPFSTLTKCPCNRQQPICPTASMYAQTDFAFARAYYHW